MFQKYNIQTILLLVLMVFFLASCSLGGSLKSLDKKVGNFFNEFSEKQEEKIINFMEEDEKKEDVKKTVDELTKDKKEKIDKWLEGNNLNKYGDPIDTYYIGGTPLFNEETGERMDRYDYILKKIPDILNNIN